MCSTKSFSCSTHPTNARNCTGYTKAASTPTSFGSDLSSQATSILQDLLCARATQSGDYVGAINSTVNSLLFRLLSKVRHPQVSLPKLRHLVRTRLAESRLCRSFFLARPRSERYLRTWLARLLRVYVATRRRPTDRGFLLRGDPLVAEPSLSASWNDLGADTRSLTSSTSLPSSAVGVRFASKGNTY